MKTSLVVMGLLLTVNAIAFNFKGITPANQWIYKQ